MKVDHRFFIKMEDPIVVLEIAHESEVFQGSCLIFGLRRPEVLRHLNHFERNVIEAVCSIFGEQRELDTVIADIKGNKLITGSLDSLEK
jgi:hypothetical protein